MAKIIVYLGDQERNALLQLAQRELRLLRAQAAHVIRQGMLPKPESKLPQEFPIGASS